MATISRVVKLANPHRVGSIRRKRRANPTRRRKLTAKQIKHFGTARQRAALKRNGRKRAGTGVARKRTAKRRSSAVRNPAYLITLGAANPHKESKTMAAKKRRRVTARRRRSNPSRRRTRIVVAAPARRHRRRRSNPVVRRRRRSNPVAHTRRRRRMNPYRRTTRRHARRNPINVFGHGGAKNLGTMIAGGLVGVAATKFLPTLIPAGLIPQSNIVRAVVSAAAAYGAGLAGSKFVNPTFGDAVMFGGLMQAASVALNAFLPSVGSRIGLNGMRELIPGQFSVPQNPLRLPPAPPVAVRAQVNGLARSYGSAY